MPDCKLYTTAGELLHRFSPSSGDKIGRSNSCDICLKGLCDETISREQFSIEKKKDGLYIKNIGNSRLFYNGEKVDEMLLMDGLVLRFSSYVLTVGPKSGPSPFEMTWEMETENNQRRAVLWRGVNTVGSSRDNYVVIRTNDVERHHAKITVNDEDEVFIEPIGIGRSVTVNHVELDKYTTQIYEGDEILLGEESFVELKRGMRKKNALSASQFTGSGQSMEELAAQNKARQLARSPLGWIMALLIIVLLILLLFILFAQSIYEILFA